MASHSFAVLKITSQDEIHRLSLQGPPDFEGVMALARSVWPSENGQPIAKYVDEDGDLCTLLEVTFSDFLTTARPSFEEASESGKRPVLKLVLSSSTTSTPISSAAMPVEAVSGLDDAIEAEAKAMVELTRTACEEELTRHLQEWLRACQDNQKEVLFESWIKEVHPENAAQNGNVDGRLYLEASTHRQIWNKIAADQEGLEETERARRFVPASDTAEVPSAIGDVRWMEAAVPVVAHSLTCTALSLMAQRPLINTMAANPSEETKEGFRLLADVLRESGTEYEAIAAIAEGMGAGRIRQGDGLADMTSAAARLPAAGRTIYARAICACCPKVLLHVLPPFLLMPGAATAFTATTAAFSAFNQAPDSPDFRERTLPTEPSVRRALVRQAEVCREMRRQAWQQAAEARQAARQVAAEWRREARETSRWWRDAVRSEAGYR